MRERDLAGLALLRQKAEQELAKRHALECRDVNDHVEFCQTIEEHRKNIYELEVSKVILELQNRELQKALDKADNAIALYENSPASYFTITCEGSISELNINGTRMLGDEPEKLIGSNFVDFVSDDLKNVFNEFLNKTIENGCSQNCEVKLLAKAKPPIYVHLEGFMAENKRNCLVTALDITERKLNDEATRTSELRLKRAELVSRTGNWELYIDSQILYASEGACKIYGLNINELNFDKIKSVALPEYRSFLDTSLQQMIDKNSIYDVEFKIKAADTGEIKDIHSIATFDPEKRIVFGVIKDITKRKMMEQRIHESEHYYRSLVETSPDAIVIVDTIGIVQFASQKANEIFNVSPDFPIIGSSLASWIAPEMREFTLNRFKNVITGTIDAEPFEYKILKNDGTYLWTEIHGSCLRGTLGQVQGMFLICRDITERRQAEEAMRESEIFFKQSQRAANIGSYKLDIATGWWKSSEVMDQIFGISETREKNISEWLEMVHPEDREIMDRYFKEEVIVKQNPFKKDYRIIRRSDKQIRWVHGLGELEIDENGNVVAMIGTIQDITERKQAEEESRDSEERFRMVFENVFDGIAIYEENEDPYKRRLIECNKQYARMAGRSREELLAMGNIQHLQISLEKNNNSTRLESLALQKAYKGSSSWIRPDGKENVIEYIGVPITWRGKSVTMGIDRDVTERMQIEADLIASKEKAEESDRLKSAFLANMSHEIRTPLNSIIGFSEIMSEPDFDLELLPQFLKIINDSGNNLLSIISDIMDISKIEAGLVEVKKHEFSVSRLIKNLHWEYSFQSLKKGIELTLDLSTDEEEIFICSDEIKLRQIMINLLGNAIKFTEKGFIEVSMKKIDNFLQFHVKDTGIGIPTEFQKQIFERFHQVESSLSRRYGGNGLGLAISKSLAELLGGSLWLESTQGKGSTFYFTIPLAT